MAMAAKNAAEPVFDEAVLNAHTMSDRALQQELFDLYFTQGDKLLAELRAAAAAGDVDGWRRAAHSLKGAALTLGLVRFNARAAEAMHGHPSPLAAETIAHAFAEARAAANAYMAAPVRAA